MTVYRSMPLIVAMLALSACQSPDAPVATDAGGDAAPAADVAAVDVPVQEPAPDATDRDAVPDFAWTLPADAARVPGNANIYLAGQKVDPVDDPGQGVLPSAIDMTTAATIQFPVIEGAVSCAGGVPTDGADGGQCVSASSDISASNGFSGSRSSNRTLFLVGVFPVAPDPAQEVEIAPAPETDTETRLTPKANQVFLIGDGKTADGTLQTFVKPEGATTLFLGFADGFGFSGAPGAYDDNLGHLRYSFTLDPK